VTWGLDFAVDAETFHDFLCVCGKLLATIEGQQKIIRREHTVGGDTRIISRCSESCDAFNLCSANPTGIHTSITTAEDDEFDPTVPLNTPEALPDYQIGYCSACKEGFYWSVKNQRWTTLT
jgi:hypothetical protein